MSQCRHCEGAGRLERGDFGSHYRDGVAYDAPGYETCEPCAGTGRTIDAEYIYPPVPFRSHDWRATFDDYEPGEPIGYGPTRDAAIVALAESHLEWMVSTLRASIAKVAGAAL